MLDLSQLELPQKQKEIIKTALALFQRFGIKRIPVEEICTKAKVSKMTFYKYFSNKNELARFIWNESFKQAFEKFDNIQQMELPFSEKLQLLLKMKDELSAEISHEFALEYFYSIPELKDFFESLSRESIVRFLNFIKDAQQKGEVRRDLKPEFLLAVINQIKQMIQDEDLIKSYSTYHDFVMEVNSFIFYGILPRAI